MPCVIFSLIFPYTIFVTTFDYLNTNKSRSSWLFNSLKIAVMLKNIKEFADLRVIKFQFLLCSFLCLLANFLSVVIVGCLWLLCRTCIYFIKQSVIYFCGCKPLKTSMVLCTLLVANTIAIYHPLVKKLLIKFNSFYWHSWFISFSMSR